MMLVEKLTEVIKIHPEETVNVLNCMVTHAIVVHINQCGSNMTAFFVFCGGGSIQILNLNI